MHTYTCINVGLQRDLIKSFSLKKKKTMITAEVISQRELSQLSHTYKRVMQLTIILLGIKKCLNILKRDVTASLLLCT